MRIYSPICALLALHGARAGKTTFFVANQANLEDMPQQKLAELEAEFKQHEEQNKSLSGEIKTLGSGALRHHTRRKAALRIRSSLVDIAKLKATPTDAELAQEMERLASVVRCFRFGRESGRTSSDR